MTELWKYIYEQAKDEPIYYQIASLRGRIPDEEVFIRLLQALKKEKEVYWKQLKHYADCYPHPPIMKMEPTP